MLRKSMLLAAGLVASLAFAGCASNPSAPAQTPAQILADIHAQVGKACTVATTTLASVTAMQSQLPVDQQAIVAKVNQGVTDFCSAHATVSIASIQDFAASAVPAAVKLVGASSLPQDKKTEIDIALVAFSAALSSAIAQYTPAVAVPASAASGA